MHVPEELSVIPKDGMKQFPQKKKLRREASLSKSKARLTIMWAEGCFANASADHKSGLPQEW